ncbi:MAG: prepilin-type N-terminal cleavage/methylation domain-containing protein [Rhodopirellula sp.]|nr:prepilin-type N-terminal cleavage/methylation domain-containing protein [Rhodopirellula sp.]
MARLPHLQFASFTADRPPVRSGFTLLEVLLATVLMATLLAGMWSLLDTYTRLFESGQTRTEQAQLVRSLLRQIADDFRSAIQDTASRPPQTPATTPLRRFGLFGTSDSLQVDIMRVASIEDWTAGFQDSAAATVDVTELTSEDSGPKAPEFRTVLYSFEDRTDTLGLESPLETEPTQRVRRPGLVRRTLDWELPGGEADRPENNPDLKSAIPDPNEPPPDSDPLAEKSLEDLLADDDVLYVPEVVGIEFRYFDGRAWTTSWNSIERKSLPAAIEVRLQVEPLGEKTGDPFANPNQQVGDVEFVEEQNPSDLNALTAESGPATHRVVVYLPVSSLQRQAEKTGTLTQRIGAGVENRAMQKLEGRRQRYRSRADSGSSPPADQHLRSSQ